MTNLLTVLPDFDLKPYAHIVPSLEKALISTADLLTLDAPDVAKRAQVPSAEVKKLTDALIEGLHGGEVDDGVIGSRSISVLDDEFDVALGGGIKTKYLTEFVGER